MRVVERVLRRVRRDPPPAEALRGLAPDDPLLTWAVTADDGLVVASRRALHLPDGRHLPWHTIDKAVWREPELTLTEAVDVAPGVAEQLAPALVRLAQPRDLPAVVRTRVTRSVAHTSYHRLPGGRGVRVVARRVAGQDGLAWSVRYDHAADRHDPALQAAAEQLVAGARSAMTPAQ